jgi:hypothetical protein
MTKRIKQTNPAVKKIELIKVCDDGMVARAYVESLESDQGRFYLIKGYKVTTER